MSLVDTRNGAPVATAIETAFDSASRKRGLLGRETFADGGAIVIAPCNAVHTWRMRFAIDLVFAARDGRVVKIQRAVPPWRMAASWRAFATIELPAGAATRAGVIVGDTLVITRAP